MLRSVSNTGARAWLALLATVDRLRSRKPQTLLRLHLAGTLSEEPAPRWRSLLGQKSEDYFALLSVLRWARDDTELRGVILSVDGLGAGWARLQGLRRALLGLRAAGKEVWVHLTHAGVPEYYLACAADRIVLTPAGVLDVAGLSAEATFFLGTMEKLGVRADVVQVGQYKSAAEPFLRKDMSPAHREMIEALVDDLYDQIAGAVSEARGMTPDEARALLGRGPFVAGEAIEARLVDEGAYLDQAEKALAERHGGAEFADAKAYTLRRGREVRREALRPAQKSIAVVHLSGPIKTGESAPAQTAASSDTLCRELEALGKRDEVAAVVVRVNSPGGSGLASDLIWRAVKLLREKKPVVVSLGDVAASGGYYVAVAGTPVLAEAGTITGSIGVIAGKATLQGLYGHLGVSKDIVSRGEHVALHSDYLPLGPRERDRLEAEARFFYRDFLGKVAEGRRLDVEAVAAIAEGRVWTGQQALQRGLVDKLGGLDDALIEAKILAGLRRDVPAPVERHPRPRRGWALSLLQRLPLGERLSPWIAVALRERVWAVMPFELRFF